jgi:hypothetical protein
MKSKTYNSKTYIKGGTVSVDENLLRTFGERALRQLRLCEGCDYGEYFELEMICHHKRKKGDVYIDIVKKRPCLCNTASQYLIDKLFG